MKAPATKKKFGTRVVVTGALVAALVGGSSISASAALTSVSASGGTHEFGILNWAPHDRTNISNYYHGSKAHRSSVVNGHNEKKRSANAAGGTWAKAYQIATDSGNKAFYDFI